MNRRLTVVLLAGAVAAAGVTWSSPAMAQQKDPAGDKAPAYKIVPHSDTQFAHELLQVYQPALIQAELTASKGTDAANLWKAQLIAATWDDIVQKGETTRATQDYLAAMKAYLAATPDGIDGVWALDHAKFIFGQLSQRVVTRMENWVNTPRDRAALQPMADLAETLMKKSSVALEAQVHYYETKQPFEQYEAAYMRAYNAVAEVEYYNVWGQYFKAMAMDPGTKPRKDILLAAAEALGRWADDSSENGVNQQALLLRGKVRSEAGDLTKAAADLQKAMDPVAGSDPPRPAPDWVQYQARYQIIVTMIRKHDFVAAMTSFGSFKKTLPSDNKIAQMSAEMLRYRITWAEADTKDGKDKKDEQLKAMAILADIIKVEPGFQDLIYEQLGAQMTDNTPMAEMLPLQQLSIAYTKSQGQKGDTAESKASLAEAVKASLAVRDNKNSTPNEKLEGTYRAAICSAVAGESMDALRYGVEFAAVAPPSDKRGKEMLDMAISEIGPVSKSKYESTQEAKDLIEKALTLLSERYNDHHLDFELGVIQSKANKYNEATKTFSKIGPTELKYIDAQNFLVTITSLRFDDLNAAKAPAADIKTAADAVFRACANFIKLLNNPPANISPDTLAKMKLNRNNILIAEAQTALNPMVNDLRAAKTALDELEKSPEITEMQRSVSLRLTIQLMQASNAKNEDIMAKIQEYARASKQDPVQIMTKMAGQALEEIDRVQKSDPARAENLADFVVKLFDPMIAEKSATDKKAAFALREVKADMMVRAGDYKGAQELCLQLQKEDGQLLSPFLTEARAMFAQAQDTNDKNEYNKALDYFTRILPRMTPGNDAFWESWLRIIQCNEQILGEGARDNIKKHLKDLKAVSPEMGGTLYKPDFDRLLLKYDV